MGKSVKSEIRRVDWHGMEALQLEEGAVRAVFVPALGGKIASIQDVEHGVEWLVDPGDRRVAPVPYGAPFIKQDMSGWDEMFPTINACKVPGDGPFAGRDLPDHGEVWTLPASVTGNPRGQGVGSGDDPVGGAAVGLAVEGRALPYRLERVATIVGTRRLRLRYTLTNLSDVPWPYLWAAHPQFACTPDTEILLPESVDRLYNVLGMAPWGPIGIFHDWPVAKTEDGPRRLDLVAPASAKTCRKHYVPPDQSVGWIGLLRRESGRMLRLEWLPEEIPHLGIWVDEGAINTVSAVGLEPARGFFDSLERACELESAPVIEPGGVHRWELFVSLA